MRIRQKRRLLRFVFPVARDEWLSILRIGLGLQIIFYCLSLWADWNVIFVGNAGGLISRDVTETVYTLDCSLLPRLSWFVDLAERFRIREDVILSGVLLGFITAGGCLTVGFFCRTAAILGWFFHLCAVTSGGLMSYGVDNFMTIGLFYLMLSPLPDHIAIDAWLWSKPEPNRRRLGCFQRVLQLHLCFIYFFGGLDKCLGIGWWNGTSIWRALTRPPFNIIPAHFLARWDFLFPAMGIAVCLLETGYPIFIWPKRTRLVWFTGVLGMHLGIAVAMGMYLFAWIMIVLNLAAFGPDIFLRQRRDIRSVNGRADAETRLAAG